MLNQNIITVTYNIIYNFYYIENRYIIITILNIYYIQVRLFRKKLNLSTDQYRFELYNIQIYA